MMYFLSRTAHFCLLVVPALRSSLNSGSVLKHTKVFRAKISLNAVTCYEICTGTDFKLFRESILRLRPGDGRVVLPIASSVCFEGNRRGGNSDHSSLLFPFGRPKEG